MARRFVLAASCGVLLLALVGCSPKVIGCMAVRRDSEGAFSAVVQVTEGAASLVWLDDYESGREEWVTNTPISSSGVIPLPGLEDAVGHGHFDSGGLGEERCGLVGCSRSETIRGPRGFTGTDLQSLSGDKVLTYDYDDGGLRVVSTDRFLSDGCGL